MPSGSCLCGHIKVEYTGEPFMTAICHCYDCRKISGGNYSNNIVVKDSQLKIISGTPKEFTKIADSGRSVSSSFCGNCGTTLYRWGDHFGGKNGSKIIKMGIMDDVNVTNGIKPTVELYASHRVPWVSPVEGAKQNKGMPEQ